MDTLAEGVGIPHTKQTKDLDWRTLSNSGIEAKGVSAALANPPQGRAQTKNAVAGVKARNGAKQKAPGKSFSAKNTAVRPALASRLVALIGRDGTVTALFNRPDEMRAFLQGGRA